jgi:hypothetical protein
MLIFEESEQRREKEKRAELADVVPARYGPPFINPKLVNFDS